MPPPCSATVSTELEQLAAQAARAPGWASTRSVLFAGSGSRKASRRPRRDFARALAAAGLRVVLIDLTPGESVRRPAGPRRARYAGEASFVDVIERDRFSRLHLIGGGRAVSADADGEG